VRKRLVELAARSRTGRQAADAVRRRRAIQLLESSPLFDEEWYALQRRVPSRGRLTEIKDYLDEGRVAGRTPHPLFWPAFAAPKEWKNPSAPDPLVRYLTSVSARRVDPHPLFSTKSYLARNPKALKHPAGPLGHFVTDAAAGALLPSENVLLDAPQALTWQACREVMHEQLRAWQHQEELRRAPRRTAVFDTEGAAAELERLLAVPLPPDPERGPLVSVVMAVWNRADVVERAIQSVRSQSLGSWELLVVDDGSNDETPEVVRRLAAEDSRITLIGAAHQGVGAARNLGIAAASGEYVAFLDSDNAWNTHYLQAMVVAMRERDLSAAHAVLEMQTGSATEYRASDGGLEYLSVHNHIDLNVLVVRRDLLVELGGFDEQLRRVVDYDLVLSVSRATPIPLVSIIGASYHDAKADITRITTSESESWVEVVKNAHLIDWASEASRERVAGRVSVLVPTRNDWKRALECVRSLLAEAPATADIEIVLCGNATSPAVTALLGCLHGIDPRISFVRAPVDVRRALATNLGFAESSGELVWLMEDGPVVAGDWPTAIREELADPAVVAVQPIALEPGGSIGAAGVEFPVRGGLPSPIFHGLSPDDARTLGRFEVPGVSTDAPAFRAVDFARARGLDPLFTNGLESTDLALRIAEGTDRPCRVLADVTVLSAAARQLPQPHPGDRSQQAFMQRWSTTTAGRTSKVWEQAGLRVAHFRPSRQRYPQLEPVVTRLDRADAATTGHEQLRWSIRIAMPLRSSQQWGDLYFARSLAAALRRLGQTVVIDHPETAKRDTDYLDDVSLVLRGLVRYEPRPGLVNLLWLISHPDVIIPAELDDYDVVFAASESWSAEMQGRSAAPIVPLLQCTDAAVFHPQITARDTDRHDVVFVGNSRKVRRKVIDDVIAAGGRPAVFGQDWDSLIDPALVKADHLVNSEVGSVYASAGLVLNDHWEDMRRRGFVSNRLFDAVASGARVISDPVAGVDELFQGAVRTYADLDELRAILDSPDDYFPAPDERRAIAERVVREHSFDARARQLLDAALELRRDG
jgi:GT2 family glycosyltransferase